MHLNKNCFLQLAAIIYPIAIAFHFTKCVQTAKILGIFSLPIAEKYPTMSTLFNALLDRGHELTIVSSFPNDTILNERIRYLRIQHNLDLFQVFANCSLETFDLTFYDKLRVFFFNGGKMCENIMNDNEFQSILKTESFDLILMEIFMSESLYGLGEYFNAPLIGYSSVGTMQSVDKLVGNISPSSIIPNFFMQSYYKMTFTHRLLNIALNLIDLALYQLIHLPEQKKMYEKFFPMAQLSFAQANANFSLILLNQHFSLSFARLYVPSMIEMAGLHIPEQPETVLFEIQQFLTEEPNDDVIYVFLGYTRIIVNNKLKSHCHNILLRALKKLPYKIIWNVNEDISISRDSEAPNILYVPDSINQCSILAQSNVKLFITDGNSISISEAIYYAIPVLGIPIYGNEHINIDMAKSSGYGLGLKLKLLNEQNLIQRIKELINNSSYAQTIRGYSKRFRDQPMQPLEKTIYWIEYIFRHQGAPHLAVNGRDLSFWQYYNIDVYLCICFLILFVIFGAFLIVKIVLMALVYGIKRKNKFKNALLPIKLKNN